MAKQIRRFGRWMLILAPLALLLVLLARPAEVRANSYSAPYWTNGSGNMECGPSPCPPCDTVSAWDSNDVSQLGGGWRLPITITSGPLIVGGMQIGMTYRSEIDGESQFGNQWIPSWEYTVQKTIVNSGSPESNGGHYATVNYPCGFVGVFDWSGAAYYYSAGFQSATGHRAIAVGSIPFSARSRRRFLVCDRRATSFRLWW